MNEELKIITPKQTKLVLGVSLRTAYRYLDDVRAYFDKVSPQPVTRQEFCHYFNYTMEDLLKALKEK